MAEITQQLGYVMNKYLVNRGITVRHCEPTRPFSHYITVTFCRHCGAMGARDDRHPARPCMDCGRKSFEELPAKWIPGVKVSFLSRLFGKQEKEGYWAPPL